MRCSVFPYIVIRHIPTVYSRVRVPVEGEISSAQREEIVQRVERLVHRQGKRACAVFGPDDVVYVEPGGGRWSPPPGSPVPDGYTHIRLQGPPAPEVEAAPTWHSRFRVWDRPSNIWAVRAGIAPVLRETEARGIERHLSLGGFPGGAGGTDVSAVPFLDGGIHIARRDGFVCGSVSGVKVVGTDAFLWCCHVLDVAPPRTCPAVDIEDLDGRVTSPHSDPAAGELLVRARSPEQLIAAARSLGRARS